MNHQVLQQTLKQLRLAGLQQTLPVRLQEAAANRLSHADFLELILQDELAAREERGIQRRTQAADFRRLKILEEFDWQFNPNINRQQIFELAAGGFIRQATDVLLVGPPGVGKTHLAQAKALLANDPDLVASRDDKGRTPLFYAADSGRKNIAEILVANKADVNATNTRRTGDV